MNVARCGFWEADAEDTTLHCVQRYDRETNRYGTDVRLTRADHPVFFATLASQAVVAAAAMEDDPRVQELRETYREKMPTTSVIAVPLRSGQRIAGAVIIEHVGAKRYWQPEHTLSAQLVAGAVLDLFVTPGTSEGETAAAERAAAAAPPPEPAPAAREAVERQEPPVYRQLLDSAGVTLVAVDKQGRITFMNRAAETECGRDAAEVLGQPVRVLAAPGHEDVDETAVNEVLREHMRVDVTTRHLWDEEPVALRVTWTPLEDEQGEVVGAMGVAVEVSEAYSA